MKHHSGIGAICVATVLCALGRAAGPPQINAGGVVRGDGSATILVPGAGMSIYGHNLSGATVSIGGVSAKLLYVSEGQINFIVPPDLQESAATEVRVIVDGISSAPVVMPAGQEKTVVSLAEPAFVGGPVWLKVDLPLEYGHTTAYPAVLGPAGFGCNHVEVRRDGKALTILPGAEWHRYGVIFSGNICGSYGKGARLPLHLLYSFAAPGVYEVRFTLRDMPFDPGVAGKTRVQSEWTSIEIGPAQPARLPAPAPSEPAELLGVYLPALLAHIDDASFELVAGYLYHPDKSVRQYAMNGLSYWPEDVASARLLAMIRARGPSDVAVGFLLRQPAFRDAHGAEIAEAAVPYLKSHDVVLIEGAVVALRAKPGTSMENDALLAAADYVTATAGGQTGADLAQMLVDSHDPRAHPILRRIVEQKHAQAANALASFQDPADLPVLAALFATSGDNGAISPEVLRTKYGAAALPFLEQALKQSPPRFLARDLAVQLMVGGDAAGFEFAAHALEGRSASHTDIAQQLRARFPELNHADEETLLAFVRARIK